MDIHVNWDEANVEGTDHRAWLRDCGIPVLMTRTHPDLPTSVAFPLDAILQIGPDYLTSSVAFYIAWGISQGYREIALFGIDLVVGTEYEVQKACAEFWLGVAHGRGIHVRLPPGCALLTQTHRYGYEREPRGHPLTVGELQARVAHMTQQRDTYLDRLKAIAGGMHEVRGYDVWRDDPAARLRTLEQMRSETMALTGLTDGALQEVQLWAHIAEVRHRGAGGK